ncbi:MAG: hypothetical protein ACK4WH_07130 [Phycisphaerales bacterium]
MTAPAPSPTGVVVLCPMKIELRAIAKEVARAGACARVVQTGIGRDAVSRALERERAAGDSFILAGACGALREVEDLPSVARVIDLGGNQWRCAFAPAPPPGRAVRTLVAVDHVVATPEDKVSLHIETGADIVDMESHAFAAACEAYGVRWHVVRGVSDSPTDTLPREVLGWITPSGETRSARAALDLVRKPSLIPHIATVVRRSSRVLPLVGREVVRTIRAWTIPDAARGHRVFEGA